MRCTVFPNVCDCDGPCFFGFKIPLVAGYVFCSFWLLFNGLTFPVMSVVFWPNPKILQACCCFGVVDSAFGFFYLLNTCVKNHFVFNGVLYGSALAYFLGCVTVNIFLNVDVDGNSELLRNSFRKHFDVSIHPASTFGILQSVQIIYALYLFFAYVYCGFILQLYEMKCNKKYGIQ